MDISLSSDKDVIPETGQESIIKLIFKLNQPENREEAIARLVEKRNTIPNFAVVLWESIGTVSTLLQEVVKVFNKVLHATISVNETNHACNVLALFHCIASDETTRPLFLKAGIPLYLYPILESTLDSQSLIYIRITSLAVIGALVKFDDHSAVLFLIKTGILPLCLRVMETGTEMCKIVSSYIILKILLDENGLTYVCESQERCSHLVVVIGQIIIQQVENPSARLLKHLIRTCLRLLDHPRGQVTLGNSFPNELLDSTFFTFLRNEETIMQSLIRLQFGMDNIFLGILTPFNKFPNHELINNPSEGRSI